MLAPMGARSPGPQLRVGETIRFGPCRHGRAVVEYLARRKEQSQSHVALHRPGVLSHHLRRGTA
jgi:hypothetical protein